jgi:hypothetical protein
MNAAHSAPSEPPLLVRRVVWLALGVSIVIIGVALPAALGPVLQAPGLPFPTGGLFAVGSVAVVVSIALTRGRDYQRWMAGAALSEVPAITGLVGFLLGGGVVTVWCLAGLSIVAWGVAFPRGEEAYRPDVPAGGGPGPALPPPIG